MNLKIQASLDYSFAAPTDVLLQLEAAALPEQTIVDAHIALSEVAHFARGRGMTGSASASGCGWRTG